MKWIEKTHTNDQDNNEDVVSIDSLKPAYLEEQLNANITVLSKNEYNLGTTHTSCKMPVETPTFLRQTKNVISTKANYTVQTEPQVSSQP